MKEFYLKLFGILVLGFVLTGCASTVSKDIASLEAKSVQVFLVRHAEKTTNSTDPDLTQDGHARAIELSRLLQNVELTTIFSTNYLRTKNTAEPVAVLQNLQIMEYDPQDLAAFSKAIINLEGKHLVVGHSNTTPVLVELLGGDAISEIDEKSEYDRLYIVTQTSNGNVNSLLLRYGEPFVKK